MSLDEDFTSAVADYKKIKKMLSNDELIEVKALYLQATVGDINTARPVRERQDGAGGPGDGQQGQGGEGGGGAQHGQAAEAAAGGLQGGAQTEGSGQTEVPRGEKPVLRPAPSMHTASLQATIAGTLQDFMVLARDDQLDLFSYSGEKLDRLGSGPLPSCHTTIASRGDLLAVSYDKTVILLKVEQVDETEELVQHLGKLTFDANVRELGWGPGGRLEIVTSNVVIGYSGESFNVIDYVIQSDENNIVSAVVFRNKVHILMDQGEVRSIEENRDLVDLMEATPVGADTSTIFVSQDQLFMVRGGDVLASGDSLIKVASVDPELRFHQMQTSGNGVSFLQGGKLYMQADQGVIDIRLKKSKVAGRADIVTFVALPNNVFILVSADNCISIAKFDEKKSYALTFLCPYCGHLFKEWHHLHTMHIHLHKGPVACTKCGVPKIDEEQLRKHKSSCNFVCTDCGKQFSRETAFMKHKNVH